MLYQSDEAQEDEVIASTSLDDLSNFLPEPLKDEVKVLASTGFDEPVEDIFDSRATAHNNVGSVNSNQPVQFLSLTQLGKMLVKREQDLMLSVSGASQMFEEMLTRINGALSIVGSIHLGEGGSKRVLYVSISEIVNNVIIPWASILNMIARLELMKGASMFWEMQVRSLHEHEILISSIASGFGNYTKVRLYWVAYPNGIPEEALRLVLIQPLSKNKYRKINRVLTELWWLQLVRFVGWVLAQQSGCLGSTLGVRKKSSKFLLDIDLLLELLGCEVAFTLDQADGHRKRGWDHLSDGIFLRRRDLGVFSR
ncbi:hypothetical protein V6N11_043899 [Hibiscus sabdariffa]|uniref:Uncharacterized protein n=1 Tax=Hibiscus sabdariffa TaxID=183260 RepID=A0ABR2RDS3_9ROSI